MLKHFSAINWSEQCQLHSVNKSTIRWVTSLIFFTAFVAYALTMPHTVGFEDSGLFTLVCYYAGVGHPPGYPLYSMLCPPFAHLPGLSPAHGVNIFSALCAAGAASTIGWIILRLCNNAIAAITGGLLFAFSNHYWSQAITQEVYALNALVFFLSLALIMEFANRQSRKTLFVLSIFIGLGLSNHWPLFVLASVAFPIVWLPQIVPIVRWLWWRNIFIGLMGLMLGLTPYLYMWLRSLSNPFISFYGPIETWERFLFIIARKGYSGVDNQGGNLIDKQDFSHWLLSSIPDQISWIGIALLVPGVLFLLLKKRPFFAIAIILSILSSSLLLIFLLNFKYELVWREAFRVYPLISWGELALIAGLGLLYIQDFLGKVLSKKVARAAMVAIAFVAVLWHGGQNGYANWQPSITYADRYATTILEMLDENAILITFDDTHLPIIYKRFAEKKRPDVQVYNSQSLILGNRLTDSVEKSASKAKAYTEFVKKSNRPVYYFYEDIGFSGYENYGAIKKMRRDLPKGTVVWKLSEPLRKLVETIDVFNAPNTWSRNMQERLASNLSKVYYELPENDFEKQGLRKSLELTPFGKIAQAYAWSEKRSPIEEYKRHVENVESSHTFFENQDSMDKSNYYNYLGRVESILANRVNNKKIENIFLKGVKEYEANDSPSLLPLLEIYAQTDRLTELRYWRKKYPNADRKSQIIRNFDQYGVAGTNGYIDNLSNQKIQNAIVLLSEGKKDEARPIIRELQTLRPTSIHVILVTGGLAMLDRNYKLALLNFESILSVDPNHFDALLNSAQIYLKNKNFARAEELTERIKVIDPTNPNIQKLEYAIQTQKNAPK